MTCIAGGKQGLTGLRERLADKGQFFFSSSPFAPLCYVSWTRKKNKTVAFFGCFSVVLGILGYPVVDQEIP